MTVRLDYDETERLLDRLLVELKANSRAFRIRASGRPQCMSGAQWAELAEIDSLVAATLHEVMRREFRSEPGGPWADLTAAVTGLTGGLVSERRLLSRLHERCAAQPVERWRAGAPQLEASLWPLFCDRTQHLANSVALALNEPAPHPAIIWQPHLRAFRR